MMTAPLPVLHEVQPTTKMDATRLRQLALDHGADDAGLVEIGHPGLDDQRADILKFYPPDQGVARHRLSHEPGADPQPGSFRGESGVPHDGRRREPCVPGCHTFAASAPVKSNRVCAVSSAMTNDPKARRINTAEPTFLLTIFYS